jgi:exosortase A-associated hydrolase 2
VTANDSVVPTRAAVRVGAEFIEGAAGRILVTRWRAAQRLRGTLLVVAPFADEMNKSRRMLALAAAELAAHGFDVVLPDVYGTGDSEGEFRDATLDRWQRDLDCVHDYVVLSGASIVAVMGLRFGALLAAHWLHATRRSVHAAMLWQPQTSGEQLIAQFLRIRVAASMMSEQRETAQQLMQQMQTAGFVEIAGYQLGARLTRDLESLQLATLATPALGATRICEVARRDPLGPSAATTDLAAKLAAQGVTAEVDVVAGEGFWNSTEIVVNQELVRRSTDWLATKVRA